jgi:hypothetical protein
MNFKILRAEEIERAVNLINHPPRKCLDYPIQNEVFCDSPDSDAIQTLIGVPDANLSQAELDELLLELDF